MGIDREVGIILDGRFDAPKGRFLGFVTATVTERFVLLEIASAQKNWGANTMPLAVIAKTAIQKNQSDGISRH